MLHRLEEINMRLVEKYLEIEKAHEDVCEQLRNKIRFIHENIGKDYRMDDSWFDSDYTIITDVSEEGGFVVVSYDYFRHIDYDDKLYIKKELLDMPEEEILKNKDTLKAELEAHNQEQLRLLEESKKEKELAAKKREYERLMTQVQKLESEIGK